MQRKTERELPPFTNTCETPKRSTRTQLSGWECKSQDIKAEKNPYSHSPLKQPHCCHVALLEDYLSSRSKAQ